MPGWRSAQNSSPRLFLLLTTRSLLAGFHGQLGLSDYENQSQPQLVRAVEKDRPVALYQGQPDDIQLAVVSAGSSHTASISRRWVAGLGGGAWPGG